ncbi:MAG: UDP-N-acetylmuramate--L-alanine ligase [bacterium]|nr:UDP-N-acetylmuramate--L-alanine ligase [bacterium]
MFKNIYRIHFVGIGGIGMSGIAEVLKSMGYSISGSDIKESQITNHLKSIGIMINIGHSERNVGDADVVVYSSAVKNDNIELVCAKKEKIPVIGRAEMLAELMRMKFSIGVAGTHGKTTTTSLIAIIFHNAKLDPTIIIGGQVKIFEDANAKLGAGEYLIAEADESDKSFLKLFTSMAVITNIDEDHLDNYKDLEEIKDHFVKFANSVPFYGAVIMCMDDANNVDVMDRITSKIITYGFSRKANVRATEIKMKILGSKYQLLSRNMPLGEITLNIPGRHNVLNSLAAAAVAIEMEIPFEAIKEGLGQFSGVKRRFEILYKDDKKNIFIVDDYAHHPAEIFTVINSARNMGDYRVVTVFQPHLYSRTLSLRERFSEILSKSDISVVTDIYPAREAPIPGVTGKILFDEVKKNLNDNAHYVEDKNNLPSYLKKFAAENTIFLFIGAGDINKYSKLFAEELSGENN